MNKLAVSSVLVLAACGSGSGSDGAAQDASSSTGAGSTAAADGSDSSSSSSSGTVASAESTAGELVVIELAPADDATVESDNPDDNFGDAEILEIENDTQVQVSYLRFVVDDLDGELVGATLRLRVTETSDYGGDVFVVDDGVAEAGGQWTEDTLTFNNAPAVQGRPVASWPTLPTSDYVSFDLTEAIMLGASHSFAITSMSDDEIEYSSKEGIEPPVLTITVMPP